MKRIELSKLRRHPLEWPPCRRADLIAPKRKVRQAAPALGAWA